MSEKLHSGPALTLQDYLGKVASGVQVETYAEYYDLVHNAGVPGALRDIIKTRSEPINTLEERGYSPSSRFRARVGSWHLYAAVFEDLDITDVARNRGFGVMRQRESILFGNEEFPGDQVVSRSMLHWDSYAPQHYGLGHGDAKEFNGFIKVSARVIDTFLKAVEH